VIALLIASFGAWSWFKGNAHGTQKLIDYQGKQATEALRIGRARDVVTTQVVKEYIRVRGKTEVVEKTVEKEVIRYAEANPGVCLDAGWRRLHDAAALNTVPGPASGTDVAPRAAEAIEGVTTNYAAAQRNADRLAALQNWVKQQQGVK
jgi:hypothetical protein